jgi:TolB-like protein
MPQVALFVVSLVLAASFSVSANDQQAFAVVDFEARGVSVYESQIIAERVRTELVQSGLFKVMERGQMETILKEQGFQQSGACTDATCVVQMGQLLAVNKIVSGSVGKLGGMYTLNVKLIDVASGEILLTLNEDVNGKIEDIITKQAIPRIVEKLIKEATIGKKNTGSVSVTSNPAGATISIQDKDYGVTPLQVPDLGIGPKTVKVSMANYVPAEKTVIVKSEKTAFVDFVLNPTGTYARQQKENTAQKKKKILTVSRWCLGPVAVVGLGVAAYYQYDWNKKYDAYQAATARDLAASLRTRVLNDEKYRNISAIVGAIGAIGLGVSYVF